MQDDMLKQDRKYFSQIGLRYFVGTLIIFGLQLGVQFIISRFVNPEWLSDTTISLLISMIPMYLVGMPLMMLLIARMPAAEKRQEHKLTIGQILIAFLMCYAVMYVSNLAGVVITTIIGLVKGSAVQNNLMNIVLGGNMWVVALFTVVCAPIYEELIFRKLLVDRAVKYGEGVAVVVSGVMFGLFHGNLSQFVYAFTIGMFLAFIYVKTRKIQYTIILHMMVNFMGSVVGTLVMKYSGYIEFMKASMEFQTNPESGMEGMMAAMPGMIGMAVYGIVLLCLVIAGVVLLILNRKKIRVQPGELTIPKGKRFVVVMVNLGMILFSTFWIVMIIRQLLQ